MKNYIKNYYHRRIINVDSRLVVKCISIRDQLTLNRSNSRSVVIEYFDITFEETHEIPSLFYINEYVLFLM